MARWTAPPVTARRRRNCSWTCCAVPPSVTRQAGRTAALSFSCIATRSNDPADPTTIGIAMRRSASYCCSVAQTPFTRGGDLPRRIESPECHDSSAANDHGGDEPEVDEVRNPVNLFQAAGARGCDGAILVQLEDESPPDGAPAARATRLAVHQSFATSIIPPSSPAIDR